MTVQLTDPVVQPIHIIKQLAENEYRFGSLVEAIVTSDPFTLREVKIER